MTEQSPPNPAVSRQFFNISQCGSFRASSAAAGQLCDPSWERRPPQGRALFQGVAHNRLCHSVGLAWGCSLLAGRGGVPCSWWSSATGVNVPVLSGAVLEVKEGGVI